VEERRELYMQTMGGVGAMLQLPRRGSAMRAERDGRGETRLTTHEVGAQWAVTHALP
jgi:hypothetical protein